MRNLFFPSSKANFINEKEVIAGLKKIAVKASQKNKNIEAVYLFGSYAEGNASLHSDADILVVLTRDKRRMIDRLDEFILEFSDGPVPVDVLVYTREELRAACNKGNRLLSRAVERGQVLTIQL